VSAESSYTGTLLPGMLILAFAMGFLFLPLTSTAVSRIEHSEASLYLWATRDESCWSTVAHLADLGILVAPGDFYGPAGSQHIRMAFTATDERVAAAVARLS